MHAFRRLEAIINEDRLEKRKEMLREWETNSCPLVYASHQISIHELREANVSALMLKNYAEEAVLASLLKNPRLPLQWKTETLQEGDLLVSARLYTLKWDYK